MDTKQLQAEMRSYRQTALLRAEKKSPAPRNANSQNLQQNPQPRQRPQIETGRYMLPGSNSHITLRWAGASEVGYVRTTNEDSFLARPPIWAVADGMGGHEGGKLASETVVQQLSQLSTPYGLDRHRIHLQILEAARAVDQLPYERTRPGTTLSGMAMFFQNDEPLWMVFNIGDSRTYQLQNGLFTQMTLDHSQVGQLVASGLLSPEQARLSPHRGVITRAIGAGSTFPIHVDSWIHRLVPGQRFLICSDGLHSLVQDSEIMKLMDLQYSVSQSVENLLTRALNNGGTDNISVVVLEAVGPY